jgi:hypothetical protein
LQHVGGFLRLLRGDVYWIQLYAIIVFFSDLWKVDGFFFWVLHKDVNWIQLYAIKGCQWLACWWFSSGILVSAQSDRHDITEILLKVALNTIIITQEIVISIFSNKTCSFMMSKLYIKTFIPTAPTWLQDKII